MRGLKNIYIKKLKSVDTISPLLFKERCLKDREVNKNSKQIRRSLRQTMPKGEKVLWHRLRSNKIGYKFRRQFGIENYVVDFYCPEVKLAIEVDGRTHDYKDSIVNDKERQKYLESLGIIFRRYYQDDVLKDLDFVVDSIKNVCDDIKRLTPNI